MSDLGEITRNLQSLLRRLNQVDLRFSELERNQLASLQSDLARDRDTAELANVIGSARRHMQSASEQASAAKGAARTWIAQHGSASSGKGGGPASGDDRPGLARGGLGSEYGFDISGTASNGFNLLPATDEAGAGASQADGVKGYTDVIVHGSPVDFGTRNGPDVSPAELADVIKEIPGYDGGPVRLVSCEAGQDSEGAAQQVADRLGVPVLAATDTVHVVPVFGKVRLVVGPSPMRPTGKWKVFDPR